MKPRLAFLTPIKFERNRSNVLVAPLGVRLLVVYKEVSIFNNSTQTTSARDVKLEAYCLTITVVKIRHLRGKSLPHSVRLFRKPNGDYDNV